MMPTESNLSSAATSLLPVSLIAFKCRGAIKPAAPIKAKSFINYRFYVRDCFPKYNFPYFLHTGQYLFHQNANDGRIHSSTRFAWPGCLPVTHRREQVWSQPHLRL